MKKYGLIGKTLTHSFSKDYFTAFFQKENIAASYENIELENVDEIVGVFRKEYAGLNVTIPYKVAILPFLDNLNEEAKKIGAVNVIRLINGESTGYNTDAYGFHQSIKPFLSNKHERAIIFGTGGASKAIEYVLQNLGIDIIFVSRNPSGDNQFSYADINENMVNACKLIVNCTPLGMYPNIEGCINLPFECLTEEHLVVDLVYNPSKTLFLQKAEKSGAMILNGESMLKHQAIKAWEIWNS